MMKPNVRIGVGMLLALVTLATTGRPLAAQRVPDLPYTRFTLDNGLEVVLAPDSGVAEVSMEWWVRVGTRDEPPGKYGLAHFFEHATPFGFGVGRTTAGRALLDSLRTDSNARTRFDYTLYSQQARAAGLDLFLRVFADRLAADPARELTPDHTDHHRANVAAEIARQRSGVFGGPIRAALQAGTFGTAHPYGHSAYGSEMETAAVTSDDLLRWSRANLRPEYSTLIVVGRMDTVATRAAIERQFGGIAGGDRPPRIDWRPPVMTATRDTVRVPATVHRVILNWPAPAWGSQDHGTLAMLAALLEARLETRRPAWITATSSGYEPWQLAGRFHLRAEVASPTELAAAERWLRAEVAAIADRGPDDTELDAARSTIQAALTDQLSRLGWAASRSELLGEGALLAGDPGAWRRVVRSELSVGAAGLRDAARRWLAGPGFTLVALAMGETR